MKIIVNADDMGYTRGVSEGIIEGHKNGIITSTTVMCHMPFAEKTVKMVEECPNLGVGVHLTLTCGKPLTNPKTLTRPDGTFLKYKEFYASVVDPQEVYNEYKAQIERFFEIFHRKPTHMDSHQGSHDGVSVLLKDNPELKAKHNTEEIYNVSMQLAKEYDLTVRRSCDYKWIDGYYGENATVENFIKIVEENEKQGIEKLEFMVHPAYCDLELYRNSSYSTYRVKELYGLCDQSLKDYIKAKNIELLHF
jgi:Uncharacterized protein conserved in bacteria